jgi:hypothetical protein
MICKSCAKDISHRNKRYDVCRGCQQKEEYASGKRKPAKNQRYWASMKGKTFEEQQGKEAALRIRKKHSIRNSGSRNHNFGGTFRGVRPVGTWEEAYGIEHATKMKANKSEKMTGSKNTMFGKPSPKKSGNGWSGRYKNMHFRSLLELSFILKCEKENLKIRSMETKKDAIRYEYNGLIRNYFPEFMIEATNEVIELKPRALLKTPINKAKFEAAIKVHGDKFKIITENEIEKINTISLKPLIDNETIVWNPSTQKKWIKWLEEN